jgi:hypothetical protein
MKLNAPTCDLASLTDSVDGDTTAEVRRQIRFPLRAPVTFTWFSQDGKQRDAKGNSRNLGEGGAYILSRSCPPVGAQIMLVFQFLNMPAFARFQKLEMSGQVVRAEALPQSKGMWGFAVASAWTILQDPEGSESGSQNTE